MAEIQFNIVKPINSTKLACAQYYPIHQGNRSPLDST